MGAIYGSSYYAIVDGPSWSQAATAANDLGGFLASITAESEFKFLHQNNFKGWIGLSDPDNTGPVNSDGSRSNWGRHGFKWESGEVYKFESWMQPIFNADGNYVHFWDGHGGNTVMVATDITPPNSPWWEGKGIAEIPLSYFSIADASFREGKGGDITITRTGGTTTSQTLRLKSSDGTATTAGNDYTAINTTVTFAAGEASKTVSVSTTADLDVEDDETFSLTITLSLIHI